MPEDVDAPLPDEILKPFDTQSWLWMQVSPERFSDHALDLVQDPHTDLVFSAASSWEIAIRYGLGRLPLRRRRPSSFQRASRAAA